MSEIVVSEVRKSFGAVQALAGIDFEVEDGSFFVLLGPSGAGKTTTLRVIAGLEKPDSGSTLFDGRPAEGVPPAERNVAMVFQTYALYPRKTVFDLIAAPLRARKVNADAIRHEIEKVATLLKIEDKLDRLPAQLSGGEQQRVALGRALVREAAAPEPRVYLMDEPLTNLDLKLRVAMRSELLRVHRTLRRTFVYVTNDEVEAMSMADRVAVLNHGRIHQVGTSDEIYNRPVDLFVAGFVGKPRMNFLPCQIENGTLTGQGWSLPSPPWVNGDHARDVLVGLRPADLVHDGPPDHPGLDGTVQAVEPLGDRSYTSVEIAEHVIKVKTAPTVRLELGERVRIGVDMERLHLFDTESDRTRRS